MVGVVLKKCVGVENIQSSTSIQKQAERERERGREERKRGREGDVGVRLLKHSKMMGNYISNYRWEQERTP